MSTTPKRIAKRKASKIGASSPGASKLGKDKDIFDEDDTISSSSKKIPFRNITNLRSPPPSSFSRKARRTKSAKDASPRKSQTEITTEVSREVEPTTSSASSSSASTSEKKADNKKGKKKTVNIMSQPTEVITYTRDEPPQYQLDSIITDRDPVMTNFKVSPSSLKHVKRQDVEEVILSWNEEEEGAWGEGSLFSIHDLQIMMEVREDTEEMTIAELRKELKSRKLDAEGTRKQLIARLDKAIKRDMRRAQKKKKKQVESEDEKDDDEEEVVNATKRKPRTAKRSTSSKTQKGSKKTEPVEDEEEDEEVASSKKDVKASGTSKAPATRNGPRVAKRKGRLVKKGLNQVFTEYEPEGSEEED